MHPNIGAGWDVSLGSDTGCGRDTRDPRGMSPDMDYNPEFQWWRMATGTMHRPPSIGTRFAGSWEVKGICRSLVGSRTLRRLSKLGQGVGASLQDKKGEHFLSGIGCKRGLHNLASRESVDKLPVITYQESSYVPPSDAAGRGPRPEILDLKLKWLRAVYANAPSTARGHLLVTEESVNALQ